MSMTEHKAQNEEQEPSSEARAIAAAIAFFKVAWVRFADNVASAIIRHLFCRVADTLEEHIERCMNGLGSVGNEGDSAAEDGPSSQATGSAGPGSARTWFESEAVQSLLAPDPRVVEQRKHLEAQLAGLKNTKLILACFM